MSSEAPHCLPAWHCLPHLARLPGRVVSPGGSAGGTGRSRHLQQTWASNWSRIQPQPTRSAVGQGLRPPRPVCAQSGGRRPSRRRVRFTLHHNYLHNKLLKYRRATPKIQQQLLIQTPVKSEDTTLQQSVVKVSQFVSHGPSHLQAGSTNHHFDDIGPCFVWFDPLFTLF